MTNVHGTRRDATQYQKRKVATSQAINFTAHSNDEINNVDKLMTSNKKEAGFKKKNLQTKRSPWQDGFNKELYQIFKTELTSVFLNIENEGIFQILFIEANLK